MPFTPWHRPAVWDATRIPDHPRGPSLRTSRSGFRLPGDPMSKAGAKARHSARNWRFDRAAHATREPRRARIARRRVTDLSGKLPRNVSDHEKRPCFQGKIACTAMRSVARARSDLSAIGQGGDRRQDAQIPDTAGRESVSPRLARTGPACQLRLRDRGARFEIAGERRQDRENRIRGAAAGRAAARGTRPGSGRRKSGLPGVTRPTPAGAWARRARQGRTGPGGILSRSNQEKGESGPPSTGPRARPGVVEAGP
jgi:hypothetical protein